VFVSPTVVGDVLYIGSCAGICYALNKTSGELLWTYDIGEVSFHGEPTTADSLLIIPTDGRSGAIYALTLNKGLLAWQYDVAERPERIDGVTTDLILNGSTVLGVTTSDEVLCLDIKDGSVVWGFQTPMAPDGRYWNVGPTIRDNYVFFMGYDGWLHCLDSKTGNEMWESDLGIRPTTNMVLDDNCIYIGSNDSTVHRVALSNGKIINSMKLNGRPGLQLQMIDSLLYIFTQEDPDFTSMLSLLALHADLSGIAWESSTSYDTPWSIKKVYGYQDWIMTGKSNGEVLLLDPLTGHEHGSFKVDGEVRSIGFNDNTFYVGTMKGMVHAIRVEE
jgi:outer membrane protein assembly factor BamB